MALALHTVTIFVPTRVVRFIPPGWYSVHSVSVQQIPPFWAKVDEYVSTVVPLHNIGTAVHKLGTLVIKNLSRGYGLKCR